MTSRLSFLILVLQFLCFAATAQDRCGTVRYNNELKKWGRVPANDQVFEDWLRRKMTTLRTSGTRRQKGPPYKIPVVVHIIHNGEPIGTGANISDAQITSQISVLNEDFRRTNTDASNTPAQFQSLAGSIDIEFVLAKQDPEGLPTTGIVRVNGGKNGWVYEEQYALKSLSYWPAEDYLNLWVCNMTDNLVGYAQYPESNLPGIDNSSINRLTDGAVIWHRAFGSVDDGNFDLSSIYNKGRTLTHELGHFFGLRHIWGDDDGSCDGDDFVTDTPKQAAASSGCPTHPRSSCNTINMFQNFMDYTQDGCMNLFTKDQMTRMVTVLENSPRRASLLSSHGLSDPVLAQRDLGIRTIITPTDFQCSTTITPVIEIRNYGSNTVTSAKIELSVNGVVTETLNLSLSLANLESTQAAFTPVIVTSGNNSVSFTITEVNNSTDQNPNNNNVTAAFDIPDREPTPFAEAFSVFPSNWAIRNPDGKKTWELATAPRETASNKAMRVNLFDYDESYGEVDMLISPVLDFSGSTVASLVFDMSYVRYLSSNDRLRVIILEDCENIEDGTIVFDKFGSALRTANSVSGSFVPAGPQDWRREFVNITQFAGKQSIQIAFVVVSDWGNNLYLDNVSVITTELEDVELVSLDAPAFITCNITPSPVLIVQNVGTKPVTSLTVEYSVNGSANEFTVNNLNAGLGDQFQIQLPVVNLTSATNTIAVTLLNPNGQPDQSPANNSKTFTVLVDETTDRIPTRQNFDGGLGTWKVFNPVGGKNWASTNTNFNGSLYYNAHNNTMINETSWLVSPVLDFSGATEASLVFDYSYGVRVGRLETLRIYGSKDCGETFEEITAVNLSGQEAQSAWAPNTADEWNTDQVVDLTSFAGESAVRIAFVVVNDNGNNLFLDNIEFFVSSDPVLISVPDAYNLYGYNAADPTQSDLRLSFNLPERRDVEYQIVDMMGKTIGQAHLTDVLNQTFSIDEGKQLATGTYLLKLRIGTQMFANRFLIVR